MEDGGLVLTRHKLTVDDFYRMAEVGIIEWKERVELIDGELIDMAPIGIDHACPVNGLNRALPAAGRPVSERAPNAVGHAAAGRSFG